MSTFSVSVKWLRKVVDVNDFSAYIMDQDPAKECIINLDLLKRAVTAVETLSSNFKFVVLPTGTKV